MRAGPEHDVIGFESGHLREAQTRLYGHQNKGVIAPPMFLPQVLHGVSTLDSLREDGVPIEGGSDIPLRAQHLMAGGEDYEFLAPLYPGDTITAATNIENIEEKQGRSGRFVLMTRATAYTNQDGVTVARGRFSVIAR